MKGMQLSTLLSEFCTVQVGTCPLYGIVRYPHFKGFNCLQRYINAFGTKYNVRNNADGCLSGVPVECGSTLQHISSVHSISSTMYTEPKKGLPILHTQN